MTRAKACIACMKQWATSGLHCADCRPARLRGKESSGDARIAELLASITPLPEETTP